MANKNLKLIDYPQVSKRLFSAGNILTLARRKAGISREAAAVKYGFHMDTLRKYEGDDIKQNYFDVIGLLGMYGYTNDEIVIELNKEAA